MLAEKHIALCSRLDGSNPGSIKKELSKPNLKQLYIVMADDLSQTPTDLLSDLKSSQECRSKVVVVTYGSSRDEVKMEDWGKSISYRHKDGTGTACAERVFGDVDGTQVRNGSVPSGTQVRNGSVTSGTG